MKALRTNFLLLGLTLVICCVAYPLVLWAAGQALFPTTANGSLRTASDRVVGSSLIAQPFTGDEYFWPRPSAASYNAAAAGGSNWAANNPKLRDRVAQQLGPIVQYKSGSASASNGTPQQDIKAWASANPDRPTDVAAAFDPWLRDSANAAKVPDLEPVPADMVTASGAGLDPHITLRNALSVYQLDRVAGKRTPPGGDPEKTRQGIADLVRKQSFTPLAGLLGEPLVNVLELNVELDGLFPVPVQAKN